MANTKITSAVIEAGAILNTHIASGAISSGHLSGINTGAVAEGSNLYYTDARAQTRARASISVTGGNLAYDSSTGVLQLTDNEIRDAISAGGNLSYNNSTGVMSYTTPTMYTDADAQGAITVTDAGGDGSLAYSGGTITYTGPSATEVRAHLSAGTGVTYSGGAISIGQSVATTATPTFGNITTTGYIAGPASMVIDPAGVGDNTGTVVIAGNLQVDGTTTTINSTTVSIDDLNFTIASDAADSSAANGAGITIGGASATMLYTHATTSFDFNKPVNVTGAITGSIAASNINSGRLTDARMPTTIGASASTNFIGTFTGNANTASNTPVYGTGSNATHYITFAATNGGGNSSGAGSQARLSDGGLTYNPSTNALGVSGNISVGGTVDGVDIAARDAVLTSTTTTAGAALPKAGGTMTGALTMGVGQILASAGSASAPSISFAGDTNTGIYSGAADNIYVAIGGALKGFWSASQFNVTGNGIFSGNGTFGGTLGVTGAATFSAPTTTLGSGAANTNVELNLNGVGSKATRIQFREGVTPRWLLGQGAATETSAFELYNSIGVIAISVNRTSSLTTLGAGLGVTGSSTFTPSSGENVVITRDGAGPYLGTSTNHSLRLITNNASRVNIASGGDVSFYNAAGTAAKMFWDASGESLSIGVTGSSTDRRFQISSTNSSTATTQFGMVANPTYPTNVTGDVYNLYSQPNVASGTTLTSLYNLYLGATGLSGSTITNLYGVYQAGASEKNYFAGNVGIGTTDPNSKLMVIDTTDARKQIEFGNHVTYRGSIGHDASSGRNEYRTEAGGGTHAFLRGATSTTPEMIIDSGGNVGIAIVPETDWHTSYKALQIGDSSAFFGKVAGTEAFFSSNAKYTSGGWKYITTGTANLIDMQSGVTRFRSAVSGSADAAISLSTDMLIDASGNVGIGETTPQTKLHVKSGDSGGTVYDAGYNPLVIEGSSHTGLQILSPNNRNGVIYFGDNDSAIAGRLEYEHANDAFQFVTGLGERMRITSTGTVRMTKGGTAFTPLSYDGLVIQNGDATGIRLIDAGNGGGNGGHCGIGNDNGNLVMSTAGTMMFDTGFEATDQLYAGRHTRMLIDTSGNIGIGTGTTGVVNPDVTSAGVSLQVAGPIISGRAQGFSLTASNASRGQNIKDWFVFSGPGTNSTGNYVHMKTNLANSTANAAYTMSCFTYHSYYAYGGSTTTGGYIGWHNWSGSYYNTQLVNSGTLALVQSSYVSSDNNVVLVALVGTGYAQFSIDWHQWSGYPFRTAKVTAVSMTSSATGAY